MHVLITQQYVFGVYASKETSFMSHRKTLLLLVINIIVFNCDNFVDDDSCDTGLAIDNYTRKKTCI